MKLQVTDDPGVPLYRRVMDAICRAVDTGELQPGDRLPAKTELARQLGVSLITINQSYALLERRGVLVQKQGSGTYIKADARLRIRAEADAPFQEVVVVVGTDELADGLRQQTYIICDILAGLQAVLGPQVIRFAASLTHESLGHLSDRSAVLVKRAGAVDPAVLTDLARRDIPVLGVWGYESDLSLFGLAIPRVTYDYHLAARLAVEHLVACGYQRLGFIGSMGGAYPLGVKFFEFTQGLFRAGLDFAMHHVRDARPYRPGLGVEAALGMMQCGDPPDALFVDSDVKALEVLPVLRHAGLRVPEDIGLVSYDDIPEAAMSEPPLTTVRSPRREIGQRAGEMLLAWARDRTPLQSMILSPRLIVRESTRPLKPTRDEFEPSHVPG